MFNFFMPLFYLSPTSFSGELAFGILQKLIEKGNRYYSSPKREESITDMKTHFSCPKWMVQKFEVFDADENQTYTLENHICRFQPTKKNRVLLGTHYDTRMWAEESLNPFLRNRPIVGANDGSSGVAVFAALSHLISASSLDVGVDIVLFDGEEFGRPKTNDYCQGSRYLAKNLHEFYDDEHLLQRVLVIDMVGDKDLLFRSEKNTQRKYPEFYQEFWAIGKEVNEKVFVDGSYGGIIDDHSPFADRGIPSLLLIDFDYPYWHTHQDTLDKCSKKSLQIVGDVIWKWLNTLDSL